jgi:hypothetical protein
MSGGHVPGPKAYLKAGGGSAGTCSFFVVCDDPMSRSGDMPILGGEGCAAGPAWGTCPFFAVCGALLSRSGDMPILQAEAWVGDASGRDMPILQAKARTYGGYVRALALGKGMSGEQWLRPRQAVLARGPCSLSVPRGGPADVPQGDMSAGWARKRPLSCRPVG